MAVANRNKTRQIGWLSTLVRVWWLIPLVVLIVGLQWDYHLPGLYMDAANPDYLVPRMLGNSANTSIWVLPGNLLWERFPILTSLYHGTGQAWLGLPIYGIFGTDIGVVRAMHGLCGVAVLLALAWWLNSISVNRMIAAMLLTALALDASYVFAWRTQYFINCTPLALVFLSLMALARARSSTTHSRALIIASGSFIGLAMYGYFIYAFFVPAVALFVLLVRIMPTAVVSGYPRQLFWWSVGLTIGLAPYLLGYGLMVNALGGLGEFLKFFDATQKSLGAMAASNSVVGRYESIWVYFMAVASHTGQSVYWVGSHLPMPNSTIKAIALLGAPVMLWIFAEARGRSTLWLRLSVGMGASYFLCASVFGARLAGHHYLPVYVFLYAVFALSLTSVLGPTSSERVSKRSLAQHISTYAACGLILAIGWVNLVGQTLSREHLVRTGGIALYSDASIAFARHIREKQKTDLYVFPDWGFFMPTVLLTNGAVSVVAGSDPARTRQELCKLRTVRWVLNAPTNPTRIEELGVAIGVQPVDVIGWKQRDGKLAFTELVFKISTSLTC
jgi:hypothetical protein